MTLILMIFTSLFSFAGEEVSGTSSDKTLNVKESKEHPGAILNIADMCTSEFKFYSEGGETCRIAIDTKFEQAIKDNLAKCVRQAAGKAGLGNPTSFHLHHAGCLHVRNVRTPSGKSNAWSLHATGRAIDLTKIDLLFGNEKKSIDLKKGSTPPAFYNELRSCWKEADDCHCSIGATGTEDPANALHDDHMHLSYTCPKKPGHASC